LEEHLTTSSSSSKEYHNSHDKCQKFFWCRWRGVGELHYSGCYVGSTRKFSRQLTESFLAFVAGNCKSIS
jgi:hypothetical protein